MLGLLLMVALVVSAIAAAVAAEDRFQEHKAAADRTERLAEASSDIRYLDEVLTMSARMYASTGDPVWKHRYEAAEGQLGAALDEAALLAPDQQYLEALGQVDDANNFLIEIEKLSFTWVEEGRRSEALSLTIGGRYAVEKTVYQEGNERAQRILETQLETAMQAAEASYIRAAGITGALVLAMFGLATVLLWDSTRSARRRSAEAAAHELASERELSGFKTQLLNMASHELNTPISALKLQAYLLRENMSRGSMGDAGQGLALIDRNITRLAGLVAATLDVARIQSGKLQVALVDTTLKEVLDDIMETFGPLAAKANVELKVDGPVGGEVRADAPRLMQVLTNLVGNAIKFTSGGGSVRLQVERRAEQTLVSVQDTGLGLEPDQIAQLFRPFSQVHDRVSTNVGGTGLGLYISKGIVEEHGGRLWCESQGRSKGSTFRFTLLNAAGRAG